MKRDDYGLDGFCVTVLSLPAGHYQRPAADFHAIGLNVGSSARVLAKRDGRVHKSIHGPHAVEIVPAGMSSQWELEWQGEATEILSLQLSPAFLQMVAAQDELNSDRVEIKNEFSLWDPHIAHLGLLLKADMEAGSLNGRLYGECLATALGSYLLRRPTHSSVPLELEMSGGLSPARLRCATEYICAHLEDNITLSGLAGAVGLGPSQFRALFKQSTGLAPHQYIIVQRVERAKQLLLRGGLTVGESAAVAGFADQSHLTRHMRRLLGITPRRLLEL